MTTLTADAIRAMPAGAELDALVREAACAAMREKLTEEQFRAITYGWDYHFRPSSEWRWAMEAAEWVGLFNAGKESYLLGKDNSDYWAVYLADIGGIASSLSIANTGALAISRAIALLALEGK